MLVDVDRVVIRERLREDFGNIQELANSISKYGLLHPIIVDDQLNLIAGERRLRAVQSLGWEQIEVKQRNDLSDHEKRMAELEENLRRKDLTEYEKSKNLVELAEVAKQQAREEFCPPGGQNKSQVNGRPKEPSSINSVARMIGVPKQTISEAQQHVKAVDKYPELELVPKKEAIRESKEFDQAPDKYGMYREAINEFPVLKAYGIDEALQYAENLRRMPPDVRAERLQQAAQMEDDEKQDLKQIDNDFKNIRKVDDVFELVRKCRDAISGDRIEKWMQIHGNPINLANSIDDLDKGIERLAFFRDYLKRANSGPRRLIQ